MHEQYATSRFVVLAMVVHLYVRSFDGEVLHWPGSKKIMAAMANWNQTDAQVPGGTVRDDACTEQSVHISPHVRAGSCRLNVVK